jgi:DNA modification methylase
MESINTNIKASSHPKHYLMHKYWGRKPHNVVSEYIAKHTKKGDTILDPFMGSGVVIIESLKLDRKAYGVDLNPVSCFIARNTIADFNEELLSKTFLDIYNKNFKRFLDLYNTKCPKCNSLTKFENSVWEDIGIASLRGTCDSCGKFVKKADDYDRKQFVKATKLFIDLDKKNKIFYPRDEILKYVKRNGKTHINMLFSERALVVLGSIIIDIKKVKDKKTRDLLLMIFTSMLPNVSKMIPGNIETANGRSGWVISKLWAPKIHTEKNVFLSFDFRFNKILSGKKEINGLVDSSKAYLYNKNSENLNFIKSNSIDYIFTDPPYGDSIAYFGLSMFWNAWLGEDVNYVDEIVYDPYRDKKYDDYGNRLKNVYKELYRVLRDKKYLSFTFHNRNLNIWKVVIDAVIDAGFHLQNIVYQEQAVASGTQGINRKNTLRGDFVYNFLKDRRKKNIKLKPYKDTNKLIIQSVVKWIKEEKGLLTSDKLYEKLIPLLVKNNAYTNTKGKVVEIEEILNRNFVYGSQKINKKIIYGWTKK